jgi:hypothetical protein
MMNRLCVALVLAVISIAAARWSVDLEAGPVFSGYNDVRIPGDTGTLFSLTDDLEPEVALGFRARVSKTFGDRHWVSAFVAPLRVNSSGQFDREVHFEGRTFSAGTNINALYRFDSYRLTYRYALVNSNRLRLELGVTAKVRDAEISLDYAEAGPPEARAAAKTNTGFVPLVSFRAQWQFVPRIGLVLDGDALGVPQGRAEDVLAAVQFGIGKRVDARIGYRVLEGGSDADEIYGFALLHYVVAGVTLWL